VKEARQLSKGALGKVRKVYVEYAQGLARHRVEKENSKPFGALIQAFGLGGTIAISERCRDLAEYIRWK